MRKLSVALGDYPHGRALLDGDVAVEGYQVEPAEVRPIIGAYRRMIRDLEFDVCELAPVSYLMAREAGVPLTAVPVFLNRRFHHGDVRCAAGSGIRVPSDLETRRVGVRAYSVTTGVWVRGILREEYDVESEKITWVVDDDDHIERRTPPNVERVTDGRSLGRLLRAGEIDAAFSGNAGTGRAGPAGRRVRRPRAGWTAGAEAPDIALDGGEPYPLFAQPEVLAVDWHLRTGIYPAHSLVALRADLVERNPELPTALYAALAESKRRQVAADPEWSALPRFARQAEQINGDPVPYGHRADEATLDALVRFARDQGLIDASPEALFAEGDYPAA